MQTRAGHSTSIPVSVHPNAGSVARHSSLLARQVRQQITAITILALSEAGFTLMDQQAAFTFSKREEHIRLYTGPSSHQFACTESPTEKRGEKAKREFQSFQSLHEVQDWMIEHGFTQSLPVCSRRLLPHTLESFLLMESIETDQYPCICRLFSSISPSSYCRCRS